MPAAPPWTVADLAGAPRWDLEATLRLEGRVRGDLLGPWADNLARRFGDAAEARVRRRLPAALATLPARLTSADWAPVAAQLVLTEAIADELLAGDLAGLGPLIIDDARRGVGRAQRVLAYAMGPARLIGMAPRWWDETYQRGQVEVRTSRGDRLARLQFRGHPVLAHPTWRWLQLVAQRAALALTGQAGDAVGFDLDGGGVAIEVRW